MSRHYEKSNDILHHYFISFQFQLRKGMGKQQKEIMQGSFSDYTLDQVLQVISIGRQFIGVQLTADNDDNYGNLVIKSGQLLSANLGKLSGFEAFQELFTTPFIFFRVFLIDALADFPSPIGSLNSLLKSVHNVSDQKKETDNVTAVKSTIMEGNLTDYTLTHLLEVISIGRQYLGLKLSNNGGQENFFLTLKCGKILSAKFGNLQGNNALEQFSSSKFETFCVFLLHGPEQFSSPICSVMQLVESISTPEHLKNTSPDIKPLKATATDQRREIMKGSFDDHSLEQLLQVVSIGRQYVGIDLLSNENIQGTLFIKSAQLIEAKFGDLDGDAALQKLAQSSVSHFKVFLTQSSNTFPKPICNINQLIEKLKTTRFSTESLHLVKTSPTQPKNKKKDVMKGDFSDYTLEQVLQVVSIGRQFVEVELTANNDENFGNLVIKSGQVLKANLGEYSGYEAFKRLFYTPFNHFRVFLISALNDVHKPIGTVNQLLVEIEKKPEKTLLTERQVENIPTKPRQNPITKFMAFWERLFIYPPAKKQKQLKPKNSDEATSKNQKNIDASPSPDVAEIPASYEKQESSKPSLAEPSLKPTPSFHNSKISENNDFSESLLPKLEKGIALAVSSSKGGVGKTTIAINLSVSLARQGLRTVLVDGDPNGDVLAAIKIHTKSESGAYDAIFTETEVNNYLLKTAIPELKVLPAINNQALCYQNDLSSLSLTISWRKLFNQLLQHCEIVIIDTSAGIYGPTLPILKACSHTIGILQAETIAYRSFSNYINFIENISGKQRPEIAGILFNMLQPNDKISVEILQNARNSLSSEKLFNTVLPLDPTYSLASHKGVPLHFLNRDTASLSANLFDALAIELSGRLWKAEVEEEAPLYFM